MTSQEFENRLKKMTNHMPIDIDWYMENILKMPLNQWFVPSNKQNDNEQICAHLHSMHLISSKREPIWSSGNLRGVKYSYFIEIGTKEEQYSYAKDEGGF